LVPARISMDFSPAGRLGGGQRPSASGPFRCRIRKDLSPICRRLVHSPGQRAHQGGEHGAPLERKPGITASAIQQREEEACVLGAWRGSTGMPPADRYSASTCAGSWNSTGPSLPGSEPAKPALSSYIAWIERPSPTVVRPDRRSNPDLTAGRLLSRLAHDMEQRQTPTVPRMCRRRRFHPPASFAASR
jgi:hypothetical protein